jgi:DNA-binding response OmpR family regulator
MGNEEISLTQREADVMRLFCMHKGELVKKKDILLKIWGDDDYFAGRSLDVFISRLRKYIKPCPSLKIDNVHGIGFRLVEQVEAQ